MKTLEKVSDFVGKYMAAIVIVVAALALFFPGTFSVVKTAWVNTLLGIVMFGMGLTLKPEDFKVVFSRPKCRQRQERVCREPGVENRASALLHRHHAGVGCGVCRQGGKAPEDAGGKAV